MKLPEPAAFRFNYDGYGWDYRDNGSGSSWKAMGSTAPDKEFMFTEEQMRQAIKDAYEDAAKVCESHIRYPSRLHFAEAIRNLKDDV